MAEVELKDIKPVELKRHNNVDSVRFIEEDEESKGSGDNISFSEKMKQEIKGIYWERIIKDIKDNLHWRDKWLKIARYCETISTILLLASGTSASLQLIYPDIRYFSVVVIIVNSIIFSLNKLSTNAKESNQKLSVSTNDYLKTIHIDKVIPNNI